MKYFDSKNIEHIVDDLDKDIESIEVCLNYIQKK